MYRPEAQVKVVLCQSRTSLFPIGVPMKSGAPIRYDHKVSMCEVQAQK